MGSPNPPGAAVRGAQTAGDDGTIGEAADQIPKVFGWLAARGIVGFVFFSDPNGNEWAVQQISDRG